MFKDKKLTAGATKTAKLTQQQMGNPAITFGQGDKNNPVTFWYGKNSPDVQVEKSK